jgi:flagellar export protein FliJ
MARFTFRLDPVLAHRKRLEDEQQIVFAAAMQRVYDAEWLLSDYDNRRSAMRERIQTKHQAMQVDELRAAYAHCDYLDRAMVTQQNIVAEARRLAGIERTILLEKTKDKKILETLREHRHETFVLEAASTEQRENDEINARRFDRATAATRETAS